MENIFLFAIIIEGVTTYINEWFINGSFKWKQLFTTFMGVMVAITYNIDLLAMFGATSPYAIIGNILTGILLSRGSNYIFDLFDAITEKKAQNVQ